MISFKKPRRICVYVCVCAYTRVSVFEKISKYKLEQLWQLKGRIEGLFEL